MEITQGLNDLVSQTWNGAQFFENIAIAAGAAVLSVGVNQIVSTTGMTTTPAGTDMGGVYTTTNVTFTGANYAASGTNWELVALKTGLEAGIGAGAAALEGASGNGIWISAAVVGGISLASYIYQANVPNDPKLLGQNGDGAFKTEGQVDNLLDGSSSYDSSQNILTNVDMNNFSTAVTNTQPPTGYTEGSGFSNFMDTKVPFMDATSNIHDVWTGLASDPSNPYFLGSICSTGCPATMLPAFGVATGASLQPYLPMYFGIDGAVNAKNSK